LKFESSTMTQAEAQARRMIEALKPAVAWARAHAGLVIFVVLGVSVALWLREHDARLKQDVELQHLRQQTATEVAGLRGQAETAMREFRANARVIHDLEARRAGLEREAAALRKKLSSLRVEETVRVQSAGTPGPAELSGRVTPRLAPAEQVSGAGTRDSGLDQETGNSKLEIGNSKLEARKSNFDFRISSFENASPELDACREQMAVEDQLIANCEERVDASQAVMDAMHRSVADLQQNIRAKDLIALRLDAQHRAELKAARGGRLKRFGRAMQYVGVGVVIGMVVAH
jgi:hypothetical protein